MNILFSYGWSNSLHHHKQQSPFSNLPHGRVTTVHRTCFEVISEEGTVLCELTGNILYGRSAEEHPCTGDWVLFRPIGDNRGIIYEILPRDKVLYRKKSGTVSSRQVLAVHVDKALIVQSLDSNFNVRRIERFVVQITDQGISPVLVLTKADLCFDQQQVTDSLKHLTPKIPLFFTSLHEPDTIAELGRFIQQGETILLTGSSGVGKSSLVNALCRKEVFSTSPISSSTGKGRHTSTRREMVLLDHSGVLIDTPGIREFGITADDAHSLASILDIEMLEKSCRYADCTHTNEPGCALIDAVKGGTVDKSVYDSYLKLRKEAWLFNASEHDRRKRDKTFSKMVKEVTHIKKRYK